jgi:restriction endonuclease S subunit
MFVHDGLVHRRFPVGPIANVPYLRRVAAAHQVLIFFFFFFFFSNYPSNHIHLSMSIAFLLEFDLPSLKILLEIVCFFSKFNDENYKTERIPVIFH